MFSLIKKVFNSILYNFNSIKKCIFVVIKNNNFYVYNIKSELVGFFPIKKSVKEIYENPSRFVISTTQNQEMEVNIHITLNYGGLNENNGYLPINLYKKIGKTKYVRFYSPYCGDYHKPIKRFNLKLI